MKVEQKELNVFVVTLDAAEIDIVQNKAADTGNNVAVVMLDVFTVGFSGYFEDID